MDDRTIEERRRREGRCITCGQWIDGHNISASVGGFLMILTAGALLGAILTLGFIALADWIAA